MLLSQHLILVFGSLGDRRLLLPLAVKPEWPTSMLGSRDLLAFLPLAPAPGRGGAPPGSGREKQDSPGPEQQLKKPLPIGSYCG